MDGIERDGELFGIAEDPGDEIGLSSVIGSLGRREKNKKKILGAGKNIRKMKTYKESRPFISERK